MNSAARALRTFSLSVTAHCIASHRNAVAEGATIRLEPVQNASDQAATVANAIAGTAEPYHATPRFWSNQFDLKLRTVGFSVNFEDPVVRGSMEAKSFSIIYLRQGQVIALDCLNVARDYVRGRALVLAQAAIEPTLLANVDEPLNRWLKRETRRRMDRVPQSPAAWLDAVGNRSRSNEIERKRN